MNFDRRHFQFFQGHRVRYSEIDMQGIVYNSHYLSYYDMAITEYMRHCGYDYVSETESSGHDFHLVKATVEFLKPVHYDTRIEIGVRVGRVGRSSLTWELALFPHAGAELLSSGEIVWVYTGISTGRSAPIPDEKIHLLREPPETPVDSGSN